MDDALANWLNSGPANVVYISFGTMVSPDVQLVHRLICSFLSCRKRVLLRGESTLALANENIRCEKWVPQPLVLSHPAVEFFVTHGGPGGVEEAIWAGKPMICIPHGWDQYYNGWIVQELGVGVTFGKNHLRRGTLGAVGRKIARVLAAADVIKQNALSLSKEVKNHYLTWDPFELLEPPQLEPATDAVSTER
jgi:glucuronosyltransferase